MSENLAAVDYLALRAEWLKVRGYVEDPNTGLPALAAVMDDLRRLIEGGTTVGVVFLDFTSEGNLEEVYGWETYDGILRQVADVIGKHVSGLAQEALVAQVGTRSDQFMIFLGFEDRASEKELGLQRGELSDHLAQSLRIQVGNEAPRGLNVHAASEVVQFDPTVRVERSIYKTLDHVRARCHKDREEHISLRMTELRRILASRDIFIRYQPIVWMSNGSVFGFEALSCGPEGDLFETPEMLFSFAERTDQILELERLCRLESVRGAVGLPPGRKLFINCSAPGIADLEQFSDSLVELADEVGLGANNIVLEITERVAVTAWTDFRRCLDALRDRGFAVAIDDMGTGYSSLHSVAEIEPDFLKFDIALVRDIHLSSIKRNLLESLMVLAQRIDAQVIAEGVEKEEEYETLREMRVPFGQGFLFSPPASMAFYVPGEAPPSA